MADERGRHVIELEPYGYRWFKIGGAAGALLYGLAPHDPTTVLLAVALMAAVTLLASLLPPRRAARTDPMVVLRDE